MAGNKKHFCKKASDDSPKIPLLPIMEPLYNFREIAKQMLLLEDHLFQPRKRCPDCIRKHLLTIEALAEEAITLDKEGQHEETGVMLAELARMLLNQFAAGSQNCRQMAMMLRPIRKDLVKVVEPRFSARHPSVMRVASQWIQNGYE